MTTQFGDLQRLHLAVQQQMDVVVFTVLGHDAGAQTMTRLYSSHPREFEVGDTKRTDRGVSPEWVTACLAGQEPHLASTAADVARIFTDFRLIYSLGCGSCINAPVIHEGMTLGVLNILGPENAYGQREVQAAARLASQSVMAVQWAHGTRP